MSIHTKIFLKTKEELNSISPTMCAAKWQQVTLHLHNGRTHSCHHPATHRIPLNEIRYDVSALHNTEFKKQQRKLMLEGKRPSECQYCWNVEDMEGFSKGEIFSDRITKSSDDSSLPFLQDLAKAPWDANTLPTYVEVSFSNLCNFKCSYCSPVYSSRWTEEVEKHGPYSTSGAFGNIEWLKSKNEMPIHHKDENPYVDAFWEWWPELVKNLVVFRITGGEPLLSPDTYKVLDYLYENPQPNLDLSINTNGCVPDKMFDKFIEKLGKLLDEGKIKKACVYTSVDGWGKYAEYGRFGLDFNQWKDNLEKMLTKIPTLKVVIMCTTNIFSIVGFKTLLEFVHQTKLKFHTKERPAPINIDPNILRYPHHQNVSILTEQYKTYLDDSLAFMKNNEEGKNGIPHYLGFFDFEIARMSRLIEYMKTGPHPGDNINVDVARRDFFIFVNEHDERRGTNFLNTFPELEDFYNTCGDIYIK